MDDSEVSKEIQQSKISKKADIRSENERNNYAEWQENNRRRNAELLYFNKAKTQLGSAMPYKDIASFRRSYRAKKDTFAFEQIYNYFGGCDCKWCNGKSAIEIGTGDKGVQLHHWQMMIEEVDKFNQYDGEERIIYLRERIDVALKNLDSIPKEIMGSQKNTDYYKLLKNLKKIV